MPRTDPNAANLYTGNERGAIGDFVNRIMPANANTRYDNPDRNNPYAMKPGEGPKIINSPSGDKITLSYTPPLKENDVGEIGMTVADRSGTTLLEVRGKPVAGQGLSTLKMYGKEVPHTQDIAEIAQWAAFESSRGRGNFEQVVDETVGHHGYSNLGDFKRRVEAGNLPDNRPSRTKIEKLGVVEAAEKGEKGGRGVKGVLGVALGVGFAAHELFKGNPAAAAETAAEIVPGGATVATAVLGGSSKEVVGSAVGEGAGWAGAALGGEIGAAGGPVTAAAGAVVGGVVGGLVVPAAKYAGAALDKAMDYPVDANTAKLLTPEGQAAFNTMLDKLPLPERAGPALRGLATANAVMNRAADAADKDPHNPALAQAAQAASDTLVKTYTAMLGDPKAMAMAQTELTLHAATQQAGITSPQYPVAGADRGQHVSPGAGGQAPPPVQVAMR